MCVKIKEAAKEQNSPPQTDPCYSCFSSELIDNVLLCLNIFKQLVQKLSWCLNLKFFFKLSLRVLKRSQFNFTKHL